MATDEITSPQIWEEVCNQIDANTQTSIAEGVETWESRIKEEFEKFKHQCSTFMRDRILLDYYSYHQSRKLHKKQLLHSAPRPSPQQLWDAVYALDSDAVAEPAATNFSELRHSGRFDLVPLGKIYGTDMLWLIPNGFALPPYGYDGEPTDLPYAETYCQAIIYPDGHPSEGEIFLGGHAAAEDEEKLRRFVSLGWIVKGDRQYWRKTGHALVVDMEPGRDRHPWIVLAYWWPNDGEVTWDGDVTVWAPQSVERDDSGEDGVLPGDGNRTPVGKIEPVDEKALKGSSVLRSFRSDFEFNVKRMGSSRGYRRSELGPEVAFVTLWFWDPKTQEDVCYLKDNSEYIRYKRSTVKISYSKRATESFAGEQGMYGEIVDERAFISLEGEGLAASHPTQASPVPGVRKRDISTESGF